MARRNYYGDKNPFALETPPKWFLRELAAFDADLVIFPSLTLPEYLIGRRARRSGGIKPAIQAGLTAPHPNTLRHADLGTVPIATIVPRPGRLTWSRLIIQELASRDIWRNGGANRVVDEMESREQSARAKQRRDSRDELDARSGDAYRSWQYRSGLRVSMAAPDKRKDAAKTRPNFSGPTIIVPGQPAPPRQVSERAPLIVTP